MNISSAKTNQYFFFYLILIFVLVNIIVFTPFFRFLNIQFTDRLQGEIPPSRDIVIIGIDDKSLKEIGAWPWSRDIFARGIENLNAADSKVIGFDILFLENRKGDEEFEKAIANSKVEIVLASKLENGDVIKPVFQTNHALINLNSDSDGIIRSTPVFSNKSSEICSNFFSETLSLRFNNKNPDCSGKESKDFSYISQKFTSYSFSELYNNKIPKEHLSGRVILIGSTVTDITSGVDDRFFDRSGRKIPGVEVHANILNSYIQNKFQTQIDIKYYFCIISLISICFASVLRRNKSNKKDFIFTFIALFLINSFGLILYESGIIWPFVQSNILIISIYIFILAFKYFFEQQENRFIQSAFARYLNSKLLTQLKESPDSLKLGGEKRNMTVLFSDIRGFTSISEKLDPQTLVLFINDYLDAMSNIILQYDGTIDKYIGDAVMALWNAPLLNPDHRILAVKSALQMVDKLQEFNIEHSDYENVDIGIGINSGDMVVGNVGGKERFDYTVLGDNVNLASRLESLTKKYGVRIIITESVIDKAAFSNNHIDCRQIDEVRVKGKAYPVKIFEPFYENEENNMLKVVYQTALKLYQNGDWLKAVDKFKEISNDACSQNMIRRIENLTEEQKEKWDGVWSFEDK